MPSVLDTAKEATYAAIGLQVLAIEDLNERFSEQRTQLEERFSDQRTQLDEQLDLARKHGNEARDRVQPMVQRTWDFAESTLTRFAELTPAPLDGYMTDGFAKMREFAGVEVSDEVVETETETKTEAETKKAPAAKK